MLYVLFFLKICKISTFLLNKVIESCMKSKYIYYVNMIKEQLIVDLFSGFIDEKVRAK